MLWAVGSVGSPSAIEKFRLRQRPSSVGFFCRVEVGIAYVGQFGVLTPFGWVGGHGAEAGRLDHFCGKNCRIGWVVVGNSQYTGIMFCLTALEARFVFCFVAQFVGV